jgi:hypothetical protein
VAHARLAADQKKAKRKGATIAFIDETGFRLQPVNRRTWALAGVTPVQRAWDRYDRLSVIGAVTLSPKRGRISTPFQIHAANISTDHVVDFIRELHKRLRRPLILYPDRWSVHRSAQLDGLRRWPFRAFSSSGCRPTLRNSIPPRSAGATPSTRSSQTSFRTTSTISSRTYRFR